MNTKEQELLCEQFDLALADSQKQTAIKKITSEKEFDLALADAHRQVTSLVEFCYAQEWTLVCESYIKAALLNLAKAIKS
jgi:hypothetical protein